MKIIKGLTMGVIALGLFTTANGALHTSNVVAHASSAGVPAKYHHTYYGKVWGKSVKYVIGAHYAYFYDSGATKPIKYKVVKSTGNWYKTVPVDSAQPTPFKTSGNKIIIQYDTQQATLHRK